MLAEPRVREASIVEEASLMNELARGYDDIIEFTLINALRRMEAIGLEWPRVDFFSREFTVIGKRGKAHTLPMTEKTYQILWRQKDHHPTSVFTYEAARTDKRKNRIRGNRYPITKEGIKTAWSRATRNAGIKDLRFHDLRHTGATRVLRASGNLRIVQQLLGHEDITTTTKYAHVTKNDLRAALDATNPTENPTEASETGDNNMINKGK